MNKELLIRRTLNNISRLPEKQIQEVSNFAEFLLSKLDDNLIRDGIMQLTSTSKSFDFLSEEEDLYTDKDLKERYK